MKKFIFTLSLVLTALNSTASTKNWIPGSKKSFCAISDRGAYWDGYEGIGNELSQLVYIPTDFSSGWDPSLNIKTFSVLTIIVVGGKTAPQIIQKFKTLQRNTTYKITGTMRLGEVMRFPTMDVESIVETPNCQ